MNPPSPTVLSTGELAARDDQLLLNPVSQRRAPARSRVWLALAPRATGHLAGGAVALALGWDGDGAWIGAALVMVALSGGAILAGHEPQWRPLLPLMGGLYRLYAPLLSFAALIVMGAATGVPDLGLAGLAAAVATGTLVSAISQSVANRALLGRPKVRVAVIGPARSADSLDRELRLASEYRYEVVGRVAISGAPGNEAGEVAVLGPLEQLGRIVGEHDIGLLLMAAEAPRLTVFDEIARSCLDLPVRLHELSGFYEQVFGHVPVADINAAWFQYIMHPRYRAARSWTERVLDVVVAVVVGVVSLPLLGVLALIIRRDGGPVLFRQQRIGEGGRPFTILKLRTMRVGALAHWAEAEDDRVTPIGRLLRRTHLDELPQVINVLRGEMSVVGPRPEQPEFVDRLERMIPFYTRRHLIKPGVTGWAQVRCGYAGSDVGSMWKVAHDLYYLKHRSLRLNLVILGETLRTLVADPQYGGEPSNVDFILAPTRGPVPLDERAMVAEAAAP